MVHRIRSDLGVAAAAHEWVNTRSGVCGFIGLLIMMMGFLSARRGGEHLLQWRGSSTALGGWALTLEAGWGWQSLGALLPVAATAYLYVWARSDRKEASNAAGETLVVLFSAVLCAFEPLIWMIARPTDADEAADTKVGT